MGNCSHCSLSCEWVSFKWALCLYTAKGLPCIFECFLCCYTGTVCRHFALSATTLGLVSHFFKCVLYASATGEACHLSVYYIPASTLHPWTLCFKFTHWHLWNVTSCKACYKQAFHFRVPSLPLNKIICHLWVCSALSASTLGQTFHFYLSASAFEQTCHFSPCLYTSTGLPFVSVLFLLLKIFHLASLFASTPGQPCHF